MNKIYILFLLGLFCSCIGGKVELKGLYSYYGKTNRLYPGLLVQSENDICGLPRTTDSKVVVTNGVQIKSCLAKQEHAIVYIWSPLCRGQYCYAINVVQRQCKAKGLELFIVAEYYDGEFMEQEYQITRPIYGVDTKYYKTSLTGKYMSKLLYDLTGEDNQHMRFLQFENGQLKRTFLKIEEL